MGLPIASHFNLSSKQICIEVCGFNTNMKRPPSANLRSTSPSACASCCSHPLLICLIANHARCVALTTHAFGSPSCHLTVIGWASPSTSSSHRLLHTERSQHLKSNRAAAAARRPPDRVVSSPCRKHGSRPGLVLGANVFSTLLRSLTLENQGDGVLSPHPLRLPPARVFPAPRLRLP